MYGYALRVLKTNRKDIIRWQQLERSIAPWYTCVNHYFTNMTSEYVNSTGSICHGMCSTASSSISSFSQFLGLPRLTGQMRSMSSNSYSKDENDTEHNSKGQQKNDSSKELSPQLLSLAAETDPILHNPIEEMSLIDIYSNETKQIVANMIHSIRPQQLQTANAPYNKAAGMAANQWNIKKRIFLFCPAGSDGEIKVIFNPTYKPITSIQSPADESKSTTTDQSTNFGKESCFSVPHAYGTVERYTHIEISYVDDKGIQHTNEQLSGWEARVWQHETDHLNGILYSHRQSGMNHGPNCTELHRFQSKDELEKKLSEIIQK